MMYVEDPDRAESERPEAFTEWWERHVKDDNADHDADRRNVNYPQDWSFPW